MGLSGSKQKSSGTSSSTASYGYMTPPTTPALETLKNRTFQVDPGLSAQYNRERSGLEHGFNQPLGAYYNPQVKDAMLRSGRERLGQQEAEAFRGGQYDKNRLDYSRDLAVAQMSAPQLTQTGTTGQQQGTVVQSQSPWGSILSAGASAAPLSM